MEHEKGCVFEDINAIYKRETRKNESSNERQKNVCGPVYQIWQLARVDCTACGHWRLSFAPDIPTSGTHYIKICTSFTFSIQMRVGGW